MLKDTNSLDAAHLILLSFIYMMKKHGGTVQSHNSNVWVGILVFYVYG